MIQTTAHVHRKKKVRLNMRLGKLGVLLGPAFFTGALVGVAAAQGGQPCFSTDTLKDAFKDAADKFNENNVDGNQIDLKSLKINGEEVLSNPNGSQDYEINRHPGAHKRGYGMTGGQGVAFSCGIDVYEGTYKKPNKNTDPLVFQDPNASTGYLSADMYHELLHCCRGDLPMTPGTQSPKSCLHLMIDTAVHEFIKQQVSEMCDEASNLPNGPAKDALLDKMIGLCNNAKKLEERWNSPEGKEKAENCINEQDEPGGVTPDPDCPDDYPDMPPGGFGSGDVLNPCDTCQDLLMGAIPC